MSGNRRTAASLAFLVIFAVGVRAQTPVAVNDSYGVVYTSDLVVEAPGVLSNDTYGAGATAEHIEGPPLGTLSCDSDPMVPLCPEGSFIYTPGSGFAGFDRFTYQVVVGAEAAPAQVTMTACTGGPTQFVCWAEASYLAKLGELGFSTFSEGFEDDVAWGATRPPLTEASVSSQGVTWQTNHNYDPAWNRITAGAGKERTGSYAVYDPDHGYASGTSDTCDINNPTPDCLFKDGVTGASTGTLYGVGGFFSGSQPNLSVILDGGAPIPLGRLYVAGQQFFGVIDTAGFSTFRFEETDSKVGQKLYVFADDFTLGTLPADTTPPRVTRVATFEDTGDGQLVDGEVTSAWITYLYLQFSEPVQDTGLLDPGDVTNPANLLLFDDGGDGFDTPDCIGGVATGDTQITVDSASFVTGSQLEATLSVNGGAGLPSGAYRLLVCGSTSVRDWAGNPLDGDGNGTGGDDFRLDFTVFINQAPVADDKLVSTAEDTAKAITLTATDPDGVPDPLTYSIVSNPAHGSLTDLPPNVTYHPDGDFWGDDGFTFRAFDGLDYSTPATVSITVTAVNDPPVASPDAYSVGQGGTLTLPALGVLANDIDVDLDTLSAVLEPATGPSNAVGFSLTADGSLSYTHNGSATVGDSFSYHASDGLLASGTAMVTITIYPGPRTWYVATTGSDLDSCLSAVTPCATVQAAVARAADGDTISVAAGTYPVTSLMVDKNLSIVGAGGTTVLAGDGAGLAMTPTGGACLGLSSIALGG